MQAVAESNNQVDIVTNNDILALLKVAWELEKEWQISQENG